MRKISLFLGILTSIISVFGYSSTDASNAEFLANQGIITSQSSAKGYRLDDNITRAEVIGMALKIKGITLPNNYTCKNYFIDAPYNPSNNWICRAVELAADDGIISRANIKARPQDSITRAEVLGIISDVAGFRAQGSSYGFNYETTEAWQRKVFNRFYGNDIIPKDAIIKSTHYPDSKEIYVSSIEYYPNKSATRSFVFDLIKKSYKFHDGKYFFPKFYPIDNVTVQQMLQDTGVTVDGNKITNTTEMGTLSFYFGDWKYGEIEGGSSEFQSHFEIDSGFIPETIEGAATVNGIKFIKGFVSGLCGDILYITYTKTSTVSFSYGCEEDTFINDIKYLNLKTNGWFFGAEDLLRLYYGNIANGSVYGAYSMRSPAGVSEETFVGWYKNVTMVVFREDTLKDLGDNTYEFLVNMVENGVKTTYKIKSKVDLENFKINNISSVKQ